MLRSVAVPGAERCRGGIVARITGTAGALITIENWRWHRIALSRVNQFRTSYAAEAALLMKDPM